MTPVYNGHTEGVTREEQPCLRGNMTSSQTLNAGTDEEQ